MASQPQNTPVNDPTPAEFSRRTRGVFMLAAAAGVIGLAAAIALGMGYQDFFRRFYFSYLVSFAFFTALGVGALVFVLIQFLVRAGWSVNIRRIGETTAMIFPILGILSAPIFVSVILQEGDLYRWALPESAIEKHDEAKPHGEHAAAAATAGVDTARLAAAEVKPEGHGDAHATPVEAGRASAEGHGAAAHADGGEGEHAEPSYINRPRKIDELTQSKRKWLNPVFFLIRVAAYFIIWSAIAIYVWKQSTAQDEDADPQHTANIQKWSGFFLVVMGLTVTAAAFDIFMSLDPHWFSTIFGIYFFAGGAVSFWASMIIIVTLLRRKGVLRDSVDQEHYHDMGKFLFGFVFFWGYIAFSQYMLLWYANLPETTTWFSRRGVSTVSPTPEQLALAGGDTHKALELAIPDFGFDWRCVAVVLLFGHLLIPFGGIMSRHVKRNIGTINFWAIWMLIFHYVNMYWLIMPEMKLGFQPGLIDLACFVGIFGIVAAVWIRIASSKRIRAINDPRVSESMAFVNI